MGLSSKLLGIFVVVILFSSFVYAANTTITNSNISVDDIFVNGTAQIVGRQNPTSGAGLELAYESDTGYILAYDRSGSAFKALDLASTTFRVRTGSGNLETLYGSSGNVGIGTTSPSNTLHVYSSSSYPALFESTAADSRVMIRAGGADVAMLGFQNSSGDMMGYVSYDLASNVSRFGSSVGSIALRATGSSDHLVIDTLGNVGVGTSSPAAKFNVVQGGDYNGGTVAAIFENGGSNRATIRLRTTTDTASELVFDVNNSLRWMLSTRTSSDDYKLNLYPQGAIPSYGSVSNSVLSILQNGNVGIGTDSPAGALHLTRTGTSDSFVSFGTDAAGGNWAIGVDYSNSGAFAIANDANGPGTYTRFSITTAGNVGIGTTSPSQELAIGYADGSAGAIEFRSASYAEQGRIQVYDSSVADSAGSGSMAFHTRKSGSSVERVRIDYDGNVGIGTSLPDTKLEVKGNVKLTQSDGTGAFTLHSVDGSTTGQSCNDVCGTNQCVIAYKGGYVACSATSPASVPVCLCVT